jgi:hypothetical protein
MRELIYLSTVKLRQFLPDRPPSRWAKVKEVETQVPGGGFRVVFPEDGESPEASLNCVLHHMLIDSDAPPRWYQEDGLQPGQWVQFEARMNYEIVAGDPAGSDTGGVLVFWEVSDQDADEGEEGTQRLLLHGSPKHLLSAEGGAETEPYRRVSEAPAFLRRLAAVGKNEKKSSHRPAVALVTYLLSELDGFPAETAFWVSGHARVTAVVSSDNDSRVVVASPLYVEYSR